MSKIKDEIIGNEELENQQKKIKEHLKQAVPEEVYEKWIEYFEFEKIDRKKIVIGYYGEESLKEFKKNYKELVWIQICAVCGYSKKLKICKRKLKTPKIKTGRKRFAAAKWYGLSVIFAIITVSAAMLAGNYLVNRSFKENFYSVSSLKVNNEIRIIQISDLHNCKFGSNNIKLVSRIEKLKPDVILLTGDCIDSSDSSEDSIVNLCSQLTKSAPVYYIYGNNEEERYYDVPLMQEALDKKYGFNDDNRDPSKLTAQKDVLEKSLEACGVKVLKNSMATITVGETDVDIFGVLTSNPSSFWSYAGDSFDKYLYNNTNNLKITAVHEPVVFEVYNPDTWGDVLVSGHTHGGVARLPVLGGAYTHEGGILPEKKGSLVYGRYDVSGSPLIVSSGLANNNILRINNKPELVIIDVNKF